MQYINIYIFCQVIRLLYIHSHTNAFCYVLCSFCIWLAKSFVQHLIACNARALSALITTTTRTKLSNNKYNKITKLSNKNRKKDQQNALHIAIKPEIVHTHTHTYTNTHTNIQAYVRQSTARKNETTKNSAQEWVLL